MAEGGEGAAAPVRRVRAVVRGLYPQSALVIVDNRVVPGHPTIMLPSGAVEDGERPADALQRCLAEKVGIPVAVSGENTTFLMSRAFEFGGRDGTAPVVVEVGFFEVSAPGAVPRVMDPASTVSVEYMRLSDVERYLKDAGTDWRIQLGDLDALRAVLDPRRSGEVGGGAARELGRTDAPARPAKLPFRAA